MDHGPSLDTPFTLPQLIAKIRKEAGGRAPIGLRPARAAAKAGELRSARIGNRSIVMWGDFLAWLDGHRPDAS